jgi:hypothetical protein
MANNAQIALMAAATFASGPHAAKVNAQDVEALADEFLHWLERQERIRQENIRVG